MPNLLDLVGQLFVAILVIVSKITSKQYLVNCYFYFIDGVFGLCYLRVPTWAPFRLQVYFNGLNGHNWLTRRLDKAGIDFEMADNAFISIADANKAQTLADSLEAKQLHRRLDRWVKRFCPIVHHFRGNYHWSFMQVEYAPDVLFHHQGNFQPLY